MKPAFLPVAPIARSRPRASRSSVLMSQDLPIILSRRALISTALSTAATIGLSVYAPQTADAVERSSKQSASEKPTKLRFIKDESGISYADVKVGTGSRPEDGDFVIVDWVAYLSDGTVFDNTMSPGRNAIVFRMGQRKVIPGLELALSSMKQGGVRKVIVPPKLAYGDRGVCLPEKGCLVPPGETLEYDLTLKRVAISPI